MRPPITECASSVAAIRLAAFLAVLVGSAWLAAGLTSSAQAQALGVDERFFRDQQGAVIVLRGLNVAGDAKVPPFRPIDDERLLDPLPEWGVNVARLVFTWEAFEPTRGSYDESYLAYYLSVIDALHARGVWVIVDVHQDAYSRFLMDGCGEGFPEWTVSGNVKKHTPDNGSACSSWGLKLILDTEMHRAWDDFYADIFGARTSYLALLDTLSRRLAKHPAVIGYDMINEPWADEVSQLAPLHQDGARVIRKNHPGAILFLSPQALTSSGQDTKLPRPSFGNVAYAPHYYDASLVTLSIWAGGSLKDPIERMAKQARTWKVPLLVGEFGAPGPASGAEGYLDAFYHELDLRFASAAQWAFVAHWNSARKDGWNMEDYSIIDDRAELRPNYRVRPYPARISGEPVSFEVVREPEPTLTLSWTHEPNTGETRIFAPRELIFGGDVEAVTDGSLLCVYEHDLRHVRCASDRAGEMRVVLRPCSAGKTCLAVAPPPPEPSVPSGDGATPDASPHPGSSSGDGEGGASAPSGSRRSLGHRGCVTSPASARNRWWFGCAVIAIGLLHRRKRRHER